jgi:MFS family permease
MFMTDIVWGLQSPTFSIYAKDLGALLTLVGFLSSVVGLTQFLLSLPIGLQSDIWRHKMIIMLGKGLLMLSMIIFAVAPSAEWLIPGRIIFGIACAATFSIGVAYVGDIIQPEERGIAFGLYSTSNNTKPASVGV